MNRPSTSFSVRVPASSANLGPGFDALGMALSLYFEIGIVDNAGIPQGAHRIDQRHPAHGAFLRNGGRGELWVRSEIPMGRGLGFSGAARVGGAVVAHVQHNGTSSDALVLAREHILALTTQLEGHPDNVAASLVGGVVASASGRVVRLPLGLDPAVVVWIPESQTSTHESRTTLGATVPLADAVFNVGHVSLLLAALAAGDVSVLRMATQDRLHQDVRLVAAPNSQAAINCALAGPAWCAWLSGSGPSVAAMCERADAQKLAALMPPNGVTKVLAIDMHGAVIV
ncbi:MAG: homoserine kinase [Ilumatobacteraceae bacterium]